LVARHGRPPPGPVSHTGGGGRHLLFAHPGRPVPSRAGALGPGLDVRGDGGYIVAPPSRHRSGRRYKWEVSSHPAEVALPPAPAWLVEEATALGHAPSGLPAPRLDDVIPEGRRNAMLTSLAGGMRKRGMRSEEIEAALAAVNARRCAPPLAAAEVRAIAASVGRYAPGPSGAAPAAPRSWPLHDAADAWGFPAVEPLVEALLPRRGVVSLPL
jgi:putative DNA primase/helicase